MTFKRFSRVTVTLLFSLLLVLAQNNNSVLVQGSGLLDSLGSSYSGVLNICWPFHTDANGNGVRENCLQTTVIGGVVSVRLAPSNNGGPNGRFQYSVFGLNLAQNGSYSANWVVPNTTSTVAPSVVTGGGGGGGGGGGEPLLGNPGTDGFVLSSTTLGVRSWIANGTGVTVASGLLDCLFVKTSATVLTMANGCVVSIGGYQQTINAPITVTLSGTPTGPVDVWAESVSTVKAGTHGTFTTATCSGCTTVTTDYPSTGAVRLVTWQSNSGAWAATATAGRAFLSAPLSVLPGSGISVICSNGACTVSVTGSTTVSARPYYPTCSRDANAGNVASGGWSLVSQSLVSMADGGCYAAMLAAGGEYVVLHHRIATTWDGSAITLNLVWLNEWGSAANAVEWTTATYCGTVNDATGLYGTPVATTAVSPPAFHSKKVTALTVTTGAGSGGSGTSGACAAGDFMQVKVIASVGGNTTWAGNPGIQGAELVITQ